MKGPRLHRSVLSGQACRGGAENCQRAQHRMGIRQKGEVSQTILPSPANENWETIWGCLGESPASHGPWGGGVATRQNAEPLPNENQFPLPSSTLICRASELAGLTFSARSPSAGSVGCLTACPTPQTQNSPQRSIWHFARLRTPPRAISESCSAQFQAGQALVHFAANRKRHGLFAALKSPCTRYHRC